MVGSRLVTKFGPKQIGFVQDNYERKNNTVRLREPKKHNVDYKKKYCGFS
jgi:predicted adenine nucleotide alpha hydrolase (AANH) superfamily ATPase